MVERILAAGWMPSRQHPTSASASQVVVIQLKRHNCSTPDGRASDNINSIYTPVKVFIPLLKTRIEQWHLFSGVWIDGMGLGGFVTVAKRASQP